MRLWSCELKLFGGGRVSLWTAALRNRPDWIFGPVMMRGAVSSAETYQGVITGVELLVAGIVVLSCLAAAVTKRKQAGTTWWPAVWSCGRGLRSNRRRRPNQHRRPADRRESGRYPTTDTASPGAGDPSEGGAGR